MEQPNNEVLESQIKKETYILRVKKRFQSKKHFVIKNKYKEEENELSKRLNALMKKMGWLKEGQR